MPPPFLLLWNKVKPSSIQQFGKCVIDLTTQLLQLTPQAYELSQLWGARHFLARKYAYEIFKKMLEFYRIFTRKITKIQEFYRLFARTIFFRFFFGGGGQMPPAPYCLLRLWLAYSNKQLFSSLLLVRGTVCTAAYCFVG